MCGISGYISEKKLVRECLMAMNHASRKTISIKCRIGVDEMDDQDGLDNFIDECCYITLIV